ncbi:hypothetical protein [Microvirga sp. TS319]
MRDQKVADDACVYGDVNRDGKSYFAIFLKIIASLVRGDLSL